MIQLLILQAQHSKIFGMILHVHCEEYFFMFEALIIDCYLWFDCWRWWCWRWEWLSSICWWRVSLVTTDNSMKKYEVILRRDTEDDTEDDINSCVKDDTCDKASSRVQWRNCNVVTGSWAYPPPKKKCLQIIFSDILITCLKMFKCFSLSLILCSSLRD